jgi:hypothetical protein
MISRETNKYAQQCFGNPSYKRKLYDKWIDTTPDEVKVCFALCILMSQVRKPKIKWYWSKRAVLETSIYSKTMPFRRFFLISRFLHFSDNESVIRDDRIYKIRPVVEYLNRKFLSLYIPSENISLDESIMKFRGRLAYVQFNPSKRARFGIKYYKLCESSSGYCMTFKIYTGQDALENSDFTASESVVLELANPFLEKGYTLYLDNWYSSPNLFLELNRRKTNVLGTVRSNRRNMPKDLVNIKLKKGEVATQSSRGLLALKWKDKKDVYFLSSKHKNANMTDTGKKQRKKKGGEQ